MPRVKELIRKDPREIAIREEIGAGLYSKGLSITDVARMTGLKQSTLYKRLGRGGDLGSMRLSEYWKLQDVLKR